MSTQPTITTNSSLTWDDYADYLNWQAKQWEVKPKVKKQGKKAQRKAK